MRHRDAAIAAAGEQFAMQKEVLRERRRELDAQARFLENEVLNNKEADARVAYYEREVVSAGTWEGERKADWRSSMGCCNRSNRRKGRSFSCSPMLHGLLGPWPGLQQCCNMGLQLNWLSRYAVYRTPLQAKQRDVLGREQKRQEELANQVELVKATLGKAATELATKTAENKGAREDLDHKRWAGSGAAKGRCWRAGTLRAPNECALPSGWGFEEHRVYGWTGEVTQEGTH